MAPNQVPDLILASIANACLLPGDLIAFPDHDLIGTFDWHGGISASAQPVLTLTALTSFFIKEKLFSASQRSPILTSGEAGVNVPYLVCTIVAAMTIQYNVRKGDKYKIACQSLHFNGIAVSEFGLGCLKTF
jgi:hypothetical protein